MKRANILDENYREFSSTVDLLLLSDLLSDPELLQTLYSILPQNFFFVNKQTENLSSRQCSDLYFIVSEYNVDDAKLYLAIWRPTSLDPLGSLVTRSSQDIPPTKTLNGEYYLPLDNVLSSEDDGILTATSPGDLNSLVWVKSTSEIESNVDVKVCYVGVNTALVKKFSEPNYLNKESVQTNDLFDFSGITKSGTRVMGVVQSHTISSRLRANSDLLWPVPDHWSLEEAATVPLAYSMAFYILFIKSSLRINTPVLIHGGAGALGQALISIALAHGCEVFTTVSNNAKKQFLRKLFPRLKSEYIGNSRDVTFCDMVLDATNGKGCRTVVTCTKGYLKNICFKCCAYAGFVIDTTQIQNCEDYKFGLHSLNLERQYVTVDFATLFKPEFVEEVKYLRTMMIKSIQEGIVRPLSRVIFGAHNVSRAFHMQATGLNRGRVLLDLQHLTLNILPRLSFSPSSWQFLLSNNEMFALKTAERLIKQGAKKIVLLLKDPSKCVHIQLRSWSKYGVEVQIINESIWKESSWLTCIQQCKESPVETVFLITSDEEADNIKIIVEKLCTIIHRSCHSLKYFAIVSDNGFKNKQITRFSPLQDKIINITIPMNKTINGKEFSNNILSINNAIDALESAVVQAAHSSDKNILAHIPAVPQNYFLHQLMKIAGIDKESSHKKESMDKTLKDFGIHQTNLLATQRYLCDAYDISWKVEDIEMLTIRTIMELEKEIFGHDYKETSGLGSYFSTVIHDDLLATAEMLFLPTLTTCSSTRDDEFDATQTYLCIVPGVEGLHSRFEIMCESLKLPALVLQPGLSYPHESVTELASRYAQTLLKKTELKNKFYLLGYESGVLVALEMAAILEENGLSGTVFCIGGSPTEILADFKHQLIDYKTKEELQVAVLKHLLWSMLTNDNTDELDNILTKNLTWDEKINACLHRLVGKIPHPIQFTKELIKAAYSRLAIMLQYTPVPKQLRSQIISLRPRYLTRVDSSFQDYSSKKMIIYQLKAPLSCALQDLMCTAIINRHLDDDILRDFHNKNLCETYLINATTFMSNDGE